MSKDAIIAQRNATIAQQGDQILTLKQENEWLKKQIFGAKSERHTPSDVADNQLSLFDTQEIEDSTQEQATEQISYERKKKNKPHPGRQQLPTHLPVKEIILEPQVDTESMVKIGEEITEQVAYEPASIFIIRVIRPKYVDRKEEKVHIAKLPSRALPKCIAAPSLITHLLVSKFVNHLPYYRQRQMIKRDYDWDIAASTINDWFIAVCTLLEPLYDHMQKEILSSDYIQADESPIKVLDKDKKASTHQGYQWVYSSPEKALTIFSYRKGRGMHGPKEFLSKYQGTIQADGYKVYEKVSKKNKTPLLGCLAHLRRKFFEALDNDRTRSEYILTQIKKIYEHEQIYKTFTDNKRKTYRLKHTAPILDEMKIWLDQNRDQVLPKSKIGKAIRYAINQWPKIIRILENGKYEIDNNLIENKIRPLALGRKNYLFAGSHNAAQRIAMMYSFFATCKQRNANPYKWLLNTIQIIGDTSIQNLHQLIPKTNQFLP